MNFDADCSRGGTEDGAILTRRRLFAAIAATIGTCCAINLSGLTGGSSADEQPLYHSESDSSARSPTVTEQNH
jgi:hypothetical protein